MTPTSTPRPQIPPSEDEKHRKRRLSKRAWFVGQHIATCEAKTTFATRGRAMVFADKRGGHAETPYQCRICGNWHLTSQPRERVANGGYLK